jgi:predicted nucleic-acid-binding Zn-ribbon protein
LVAHSPDTICDFITTHTYLKGQPFSFAGHEYQKEILQDKARNIVILKSAQIGISEMSARLAVARAVLVNGFSTIYTLPSASAAQSFMKTRISPIVDSSPYLRELVSIDVDNSSVKRFGDSYIYLKGCQVDRQAISTPADMVIFDETDNSDQDVMTLFESRIIHSPYKMTVKLSTPTIPGYGISKAFEQSRRKFNFAQCSCCNEWFYPEYYTHVRVPNFSKPLEEIKKSDFASPTFLWHQAEVFCPKCGSTVNMLEAKRNWVIENPGDAYFDSGYRVSPFDAPATVTPGDLVKASVTFTRPQDFVNQRLGIPMADSETSLADDELERALISEYPGGGHSYVAGLDMGNTCWIKIGAVFPDNKIVVVKAEPIPVHLVVSRVEELVRQYRIRMLVVDRGPMTEAVYQIQQRVRNSFAAVFVQSQNVQLFTVKDQEENLDKGVSGMRQVNINKDSVMDLMMAMIRTGEILKVSCEYDRTWKTHLMDNKRIKAFKNGEMVYTWVKTAGEDHYAMAGVYMIVASRILGVASGSAVQLPMFSTFKQKAELS